MNLLIKVKEQKISLILKKGDEIADKIGWEDKNDFCNTAAAKHLLFFRHFYRRGVSKVAECASHAAWEA